MNNYLQQCKLALGKTGNSEQIYTVLGNESCDLDSAISALIYAYFLNCQFIANKCKTPVFPVLNIDQKEFPLRTETKYFLQKVGVDIEKLIFRNQINLSTIAKENKLKLVLVDHHVLSQQDKCLAKNVIEIIDHRPVDKNSKWENVDVIINTTGSCATLIANKIFSSNVTCLDNVAAKLLHGTIVLDTVNFNKSANRFTELDVEVISKLEKDFEISYTRDQIYNELTTARSDVSSLTPFQILHRDMKIINGVPFPGVPMLVSEFLNLPGAFESFAEFCRAQECKVIVPMGLVTRGEKVFREVGVFAVEDSRLQKALVDKLKGTKDLLLTEIENKNMNGLILFSQGNVKASRKHIVPILSEVISLNQ